MMEKLDNGIVNNDNASNSNNDSNSNCNCNSNSDDNIKIDDDENDEENGCSSSSSSSCSYTYASAVQALLSSPGLHQSTTKEDIAKAARRRTRTVSDMRYYWKKIRRYHTGKNNNVKKQQTQQQQQQQQQQHKVLPLLIHITGTKGKGSTACLCEAILRGHGYSTGLFTSPHLLNIRERIRWNGKPINEQIFAQVYWTIRQALEVESDNEYDEYEYEYNDDDDNNDERLPPTIPGYFRMLTLMGLYTFLYELNSLSSSSSSSITGSGVGGGVGVDVIIMEVGMGGRYDATNFLDTTTNFRRVVHGVTILDFDHTRILGETLEQIAWEKGGIFATNKLNPNGTSVPPKPATTITTAPTKSKSATTTNPQPKKDSKFEEEEEELPSSLSLSSSSSSVLMSSSSSNCYILDSNTTEVVNMMKSCACVEGNNGNNNGEEEEEALILVDATGMKLKEAFVSFHLSLGLAGNHQYGNATLAVALCQAVTTTLVDNDQHKNASLLSMTATTTTTTTSRRAKSMIDLNSFVTVQALSKATWPGRCQTLLWSSEQQPDNISNNSTMKGNEDDTNDDGYNQNIQFYLDGAHTPQSLAATVEWFRSKTSRSTRNTTNNINIDGRNNDNNGGSILVFNCSHERNPVELLELLFQLTSPSSLSSSSSKQQQPPPPPPMIPFSRVYFAKSDSFRPSPIDPPSAESLLNERGIQIQPELVSVCDTENNDTDKNKEEPATTTTTTTTTRTWQETLAIIWKHLVYNDNEKKTENNNENKNKNNGRTTMIRCNMTATEIVQEIVQQQQQQHDERQQRQRQGSNNNEDNQHKADNDHDNNHDHNHNASFQPQTVFVTGSLYLVGSFLTAVGWHEESSSSSNESK